MTYIYTLSDPRNDAVRYVGKANDPATRLGRHLKDKSQNHRVNWIQSLVKEGLKPTLTIIQKVAKEEWQFWERLWIAMYQATGHDLTNSTAGGDGIVDPSLEVRKKQSVSMVGNKNALGRVPTPEQCAKMIGNKYGLGSKSRTGQKQTMEERAKKSVALKGRKQTPEHVAKRAATLIGNTNGLGSKGRTGQKQSVEERARRSAALKGRKHTPERVAKVAAALIGNTNGIGNKGRKQSVGERAKHSVAMMGNKNAFGKKQSPEHVAKRTASRLERMNREKGGGS